MTTVEQQTEQPKETRGRPRNATPFAPVQLRIPRKLYAQMRQRAAKEGLPIATWLRFAAVRELRRKKSSL